MYHFNDSELFPEAEQLWDLERLYGDLDKIPSPNAKLFLKGVLLGYSPKEIGEQQGYPGKRPGETVSRTLSDEIYSSVENLCGTRPSDYRRLPKLLEAYKIAQPSLKASIQASDIDWSSICWKVLEEKRQPNINQLLSKKGVSFRTSDLFISLGLVEKRQQDRRPGNVPGPEQGSRLYELQQEEVVRRFDRAEEFFETVIQGEQSPRIMIIGEPGAGKTTILQTIATQLPNGVLPVWVSLADLRGYTLDEYLFGGDWLKLADRTLPREAGEEFKQLFKEGQVCLLLDGVDEMAVAGGRSQLKVIYEQVRGWEAYVRVIMTCRVNVWEAAPLFEKFQVYRNLPLAYPDQVEQYIDNFFRNPALPVQSGEALKQELRSNARVQDTVKNPLRLALLCHSWFSCGGKLPETQAKLYEMFLEAFYEIKQEKFDPMCDEDQDKLNQALGKLALEALDRDQSWYRIDHATAKKILGDPKKSGSFFYQALQLGLLNRIGFVPENPSQECYAFIHPTFQEYLAAYVAEITFFQENRVSYRFLEYKWIEVLCLWFELERYAVNDKAHLFKQMMNLLEDPFYGDKTLNILALIATRFYALASSEKAILLELAQESSNFSAIWCLQKAEHKGDDDFTSFPQKQITRIREPQSIHYTAFEEELTIHQIIKALIESRTINEVHRVIQSISFIEFDSFIESNLVNFVCQDQASLFYKRLQVAVLLVKKGNCSTDLIEFLFEALSGKYAHEMSIEEIRNYYTDYIFHVDYFDYGMYVSDAYQALCSLEGKYSEILNLILQELQESNQERYYCFPQIIEEIVKDKNEVEVVISQLSQCLDSDSLDLRSTIVANSILRLDSSNKSAVNLLSQHIKSNTRFQLFCAVDLWRYGYYELAGFMTIVNSWNQNLYESGIFGDLRQAFLGETEKVDKSIFEYILSYIKNKDNSLNIRGLLFHLMTDLARYRDLYIHETQSLSKLLILEETNVSLLTQCLSFSKFFDDKFNAGLNNQIVHKILFLLNNNLSDQDRYKLIQLLGQFPKCRDQYIQQLVDLMCTANGTFDDMDDCNPYVWNQCEICLGKIEMKQEISKVIRILGFKIENQNLICGIDQLHACYRVLRFYADKMPYLQFYSLLHELAGDKETMPTGSTPQTQQLNNQLLDLQTQLTPTATTYPLCLNLSSLQTLSDRAELCQALALLSYEAIDPHFDTLEIPENIQDPAQLKTALLKLRKHLQTPNLALILHNSDPTPELLNILTPLSSSFPIAWITNQPLEYPYRSFLPTAANLPQLLQTWLSQ